VFRENITETFYFSVLGILALMFGSLIINVMFNLTRIAEKHNQDNVNSTKAVKKLWLIFGLSFPVIFGLLFGGDYLTSRKKEQMLISSAKSIIESDREKSDKLLSYNFSKEWINETSNILTIYSKTDTYFPNIIVIALDSIENSQAFLGFNRYEFISQKDTIPPQKKNYIWKTTKVEREYLLKVFHESFSEIRFSARGGRYELFYPYYKDGKIIVLYFSDRQEYGKIGS
jgi:NADH:ubiquinone oxidoreductase subunit 5 (subunit L)/multisubunit Na+/H+ antiporter MnhA subunit